MSVSEGTPPTAPILPYSASPRSRSYLWQQVTQSLLGEPSSCFLATFPGIQRCFRPHCPPPSSWPLLGCSLCQESLLSPTLLASISPSSGSRCPLSRSLHLGSTEKHSLLLASSACPPSASSPTRNSSNTTSGGCPVKGKMARFQSRDSLQKCLLSHPQSCQGHQEKNIHQREKETREKTKQTKKLSRG